MDTEIVGLADHLAIDMHDFKNFVEGTKKWVCSQTSLLRRRKRNKRLIAEFWKATLLSRRELANTGLSSVAPSLMAVTMTFLGPLHSSRSWFILQARGQLSPIALNIPCISIGPSTTKLSRRRHRSGATALTKSKSNVAIFWE